MSVTAQTQWFGTAAAKGDLGEPINQSLRFTGPQRLVSADTMPSGDFTVSFWHKRADGPNNTQTFLCFAPNQSYQIYDSGSGPAFYSRRGGSVGNPLSGWLRDYSAWYHVLWVVKSGTTQAWINGKKQENSETAPSGSSVMTIGSNGDSYQDDRLAGYLAEFNLLDGQTLSPTDFGRFNEDGVWVPIALSFTSAQYGAKGFRLTFDSSQNANPAVGIGIDSAPIGTGHSAANNFTSVDFVTAVVTNTNRITDIDYKDTPTSNYTTFNPLWTQTNPGLKGASMEITTAQVITGQSTFRFPVGTTGKYWVEAGTQSYGWTTNAPALCLTSELNAAGLTGTAWSTTANYSSIGGYQASYSNFNSSSANSYTTVGGHVAMGIDFDNQEVKMYNNSTLINTDTTVDFTKELAITVMQPTTSYNTYDPYLNAGQQALTQTVPAGFKELQTNNLPAPTIKKSSDYFQVVLGSGNNPTSLSSGHIAAHRYENPAGYLQAATDYNIGRAFDGTTATFTYVPVNTNYTETFLEFDTPMTGTTFRVYVSIGQGGFQVNGTTISGNRSGWFDISSQANGSLKTLGFGASSSASDGFAALEIDGNIVVDLAILQKAQAAITDGLWWIKNRQYSSEHQVIDSVRGGTLTLQSPTNGADTSYSVLSGASVAWCWKGGGAAVANNDGTTQTQVSANTDAGFSIMTYQGTGSVGATIGHGLNQAPDFIVIRKRGADYWTYWHTGLNTTQGYGYLNYPLSFQTTSSLYTNTASNSGTTITFDANSSVNHNGHDYVGYVWHSVPGYSRFGSYEGTGNSNGEFVYLGFQPALLWVKNADNSGGDWQFFDNQRDLVNNSNAKNLTPNSAAIEGSGYIVDLLSNGFKIRDSSTHTNSSGHTFFYCAWAEHPFGGETAAPGTAR